MDIRETNLILKQMQNGDFIKKYYRGIFVEFLGKRRVLSTSVLNGGITEGLSAVFNYNCLAENYSCEMHEASYEMELKSNAKKLGLDGDAVTGLSTAAWMEMASIVEETYEDLCVTSIVTGGVDKNAVRAGDPASYYEVNGEYHRLPPGTINIILMINKNLSAGVLTRALVTCTEAKVTAVEELMIGSLYSNGIATGSGTDGTIIVCDAETTEYLTDAGEHSKLGELIGRVVKKAVKEALFKQTGACGARQHNVVERARRYGITLGSLQNYYSSNKEKFSLDLDMKEFEQRFEKIKDNSNVVVWTSLYLHLLDQYRYGLLEWGEVLRECKVLSTMLLQSNKSNEINEVFSIPLDEPILKNLVECLKAILIYHLL